MWQQTVMEFSVKTGSLNTLSGPDGSWWEVDLKPSQILLAFSTQMVAIKNQTIIMHPDMAQQQKNNNGNRLLKITGQYIQMHSKYCKFYNFLFEKCNIE